jgi:hypothetical protein
MLEFKLVMLPNPVLVNNEELKAGDIILCGSGFIHPFEPKCRELGGKKIIAGLTEIPKLDLSFVAGQIGYVDVEKLAEKANGYGDVYGKGLDKYNAFNEGFIAGFNANPKKYTEEDLRLAITSLWMFGQKQENNLTDSIDLIINTLKQPKVYNVEVETQRVRYPKGDDGWEDVYRPKIINNTIKVTKILSLC